MKTISRKEACQLGLKHYFTGKPCKKNHIALRFVCDASCIKCKYVSTKRWQKDNIDKQRKCTSNWAKNNPEKNRRKAARYRSKNKEKLRNKQKEHRANNPESHIVYRARSYEKRKGTHGQRLRDLCSHTMARLKRGKIPTSTIGLLPYDANIFRDHLLKDFIYFSSLSDARDNGYEIDHIVPVKYFRDAIDDIDLAFRMMMDLENLRLITFEENRSKRSRYDSGESRRVLVYLFSKYFGVKDANNFN